MKKIIFLLSFLLLALPAHAPNAQMLVASTWAQGTTGAVTWTLIQHLSNFTCSTDSCSKTGVTTTAGDLLVLCSAIEATSPSFSSASGDGTWTHPAGVAGVQGIIATDCVYRLSATGGTGLTINFTWTGSSPIGSDIEFYEVRRSTGTATYDVGNKTTSSDCTSCTGPALTLTGSSDFIAQIGNFVRSFTAPGAPWTNPSDLDNGGNLDAGFLGALNQSSGGAVTWSQSPSAAASMSALSFK
jgi:hypothetical protein